VSQLELHHQTETQQPEVIFLRVLSELPDVAWSIPDLAPTTGDPEFTIYTAVNLDLYLTSNPEGFAGGNWDLGETLNDVGVIIAAGQVSGSVVEGIYWSTSPFTFDPDSDTGWVPEDGTTGWLDSEVFRLEFGDIEILAAHESDELPSQECGNDIREGSEECDGTDDVVCSGNCLPDCTCGPGTGVPTVPEWGLIGLGVLLLAGGVFVFGRRRRPAEVA
jgi:hypothetical protein